LEIEIEDDKPSKTKSAKSDEKISLNLDLGMELNNIESSNMNHIDDNGLTITNLEDIVSNDSKISSNRK